METIRDDYRELDRASLMAAAVHDPKRLERVGAELRARTVQLSAPLPPVVDQAERERARAMIARLQASGAFTEEEAAGGC